MVSSSYPQAYHTASSLLKIKKKADFQIKHMGLM